MEIAANDAESCNVYTLNVTTRKAEGDISDQMAPSE